MCIRYSCKFLCEEEAGSLAREYYGDVMQIASESGCEVLCYVA